MRLVITLLSLTVTMTALVAVNGALISGVSEESMGSGIRWSRVQLADAAAMVLLGLLGAALVWVLPQAAEATLWAAMGAGLIGIAVEGGMLAAAYNENMTAPLMAASVLVSGAAPAVIAALAALLTHRFVLPSLLAVAG
jgi:hypothetical protein